MAASGGRGSRGTGAGRPHANRSAGGAAASRKPAPGKSGKPAKPPNSGKSPKPGQKARAARPTPGASPAPQLPLLPPGPFRLGATPGATPGKWIDVWQERMPRHPLELVPLGIDDQRTAVADSSVDAALVRLPFAADGGAVADGAARDARASGIAMIPLYDELAVVVCAADSHLTAADELTLADLAGEVVIEPRHAPLDVVVAGGVRPSFAPPASVEEAISIVASGVGIVVVPMSLARLHHRKDTAYRPVVDAARSPIALAWRLGDDGQTPPLVDVFIGIVRGRTANSSR